MGQAKATLEGTRRLFQKGFVTKIDLERDDIAYENARLKVQTAETARDLFLKYEFSKSAEESLSKDAEALRELDRARKAAVSKLAQADAKLKSAQGNYNLQKSQRKDLNEQLEKCVLRAKRAGLIVYGGGGEEMYYYGNQEPIREGATVRERQTIITIPDMTKMSVKVKIHETYIKKVGKGQKARITIDAFPDQTLTGEVTKVGVLPDSQNRWMNPDLKVYVTTITINGTYDWIKPGMSAKVEILVNHLNDVVHVPIQAVAPTEGKQIFYVVNGLRQEKREVDIGQFNDLFIEIKKGLKEGEKVLLHAPESGEPDSLGKEKKPANDDNEKSKPEEKPTAPKAPPAGKA
jgi:HlyD family secretion protein